MENSLKFDQKTKNRVTIWPSNPTPGHLPRENHSLKRYMHPSVHCSTVYNIPHMEANLMSIDRRMNKEDANTCNGISLSHEKEWNNDICSNMDGLRDYHTKWNKLQKGKHYILLIFGILKDANELICRTNSPTLKNQRGQMGRGGMDLGGSLGLAYAHKSIWNSWPTGTCCILQGTLHNILW